MHGRPCGLIVSFKLIPSLTALRYQVLQCRVRCHSALSILIMPTEVLMLLMQVADKNGLIPRPGFSFLAMGSCCNNSSSHKIWIGRLYLLLLLTIYPFYFHSRLNIA